MATQTLSKVDYFCNLLYDCIRDDRRADMGFVFRAMAHHKLTEAEVEDVIFSLRGSLDINQYTRACELFITGLVAYGILPSKYAQHDYMAIAALMYRYLISKDEARLLAIFTFCVVLFSTVNDQAQIKASLMKLLTPAQVDEFRTIITRGYIDAGNYIRSSEAE